jgi:hypothetical protein
MVLGVFDYTVHCTIHAHSEETTIGSIRSWLSDGVKCVFC